MLTVGGNDGLEYLIPERGDGELERDPDQIGRAHV